MADWATISGLATGGGTLVLAVATFASVRSSNRSARLAEQALQEQRRPVLVHSRGDDRVEAITFADGRRMTVPGGGAAVEVVDDVVFLALSLRNVGAGIAVLQGWYPRGSLATANGLVPDVDQFRPLRRDQYIAGGDVGVWQGALRDPAEPIHTSLATAAKEHQSFGVSLLYTDQVGGQRTISTSDCSRPTTAAGRALSGGTATSTRSRRAEQPSAAESGAGLGCDVTGVDLLAAVKAGQSGSATSPQASWRSTIGGPGTSEMSSPQRMRATIAGKRSRPASVSRYSYRSGRGRRDPLEQAGVDKRAQPRREVGRGMPRLRASCPKRRTPKNASRRISSVQRSPTRPARARPTPPRTGAKIVPAFHGSLTVPVQQLNRNVVTSGTSA